MAACWCLLSTLSAQQKTVPVFADVNKPLEQRVEDALSRMTLEEKVALCHAQSKFSSAGVPRLGIPEVWMSDGPHGVREENVWDEWGGANWSNDSCTAFPALTCLAATFNPDLSYQYGIAVGEEARYRNKTMLLGPGLNIYRTPMNGRNFEYMGEDPWLASIMVVPYIQGLQSNGVSACVKHFALNNQETNRDNIDVEVSDRALYEIYLPAFKAAVQKGKAWGIMGSYNQYQGQHCCHNDRLLNQILKKEWGFDGVVVSDWGGTHNTKQAALNGLDIEMGSYTNGMSTGRNNSYQYYYLARPFLALLQKGEVPQSVVDDKARRVLRLIFRTTLSANRPFGRFVCPEHSQVARKIGGEGIVLLKNQQGFLPLKREKLRTIAVIGDNATRSLTKGGGSSELKVKYEVSPLEAIKTLFGSDKVVYRQGYTAGAYQWGREMKTQINADTLLKAALDVARTADAVVFVGGLNKNHLQDCEGGDRVSYGLPFGQEKLLEELSKVNPNIVVVLLSGNAVAMPWLDKVKAVVQAWYIGSEAGNAIADVLSGAVNPSGRLPFTFPKRLEDNGAMSFGISSFPGEKGKQTYKEDILVGYRWHEAKQIAPLFPFGFGLSYTTFEYGKLRASYNQCKAGETIQLTLTVKNTGKVDGAEVVQIYASQQHPSVLRPVKELKAFQKVFLKAGEQKTVSLEINANDLAFFDEAKHAWKLEPDTYTFHCAASAADTKSKVDVRIVN